MSVVMKFGGTSVADQTAIGRLIEIVRSQIDARRGDAPLVVVSALGGVTDRLFEAARLAEDGRADAAIAIIDAVRERHLITLSALTSGERQSDLARSVHAEFETLASLVRALTVLREASPRSLDAMAAAGELVSSRIVAAALTQAGLAAEWVDARQIMITNAEHTAAAPDMDQTCRRTRDRIDPLRRRGVVGVAGGYVGATRDGVTTTLGRGGSDYSAAIFGACLDASEIQIWTDVDGMLTADPRIVADPRLVPQLSFAEASELAYFGAKVLHPSTILPAVAKAIPVRILNARRPHTGGTLITGSPDVDRSALAAIACKRGVTVVDITSTRMLMAHGFLRRLFEVFERFQTPVDVVTTSEVSVSVTVDDTRRLDAVVDNLRTFADVVCEPDMAIVCAVGESLRGDPSVFARAVTALGRIPLRLVSQAAGRRNVTFVLRNADVVEAMTRLHDVFFAGFGTAGAAEAVQARS